MEGILNAMFKRKRDYCNFAPVGEGCLYWLGSTPSVDSAEDDITGNGVV